MSGQSLLLFDLSIQGRRFRFDGLALLVYCDYSGIMCAELTLASNSVRANTNAIFRCSRHESFNTQRVGQG